MTTLDVTPLRVGSYGANTLSSAFTNPAGKTFTNASWTATSTKYIAATDYRYVVVESRTASRDMEVDTWARNGLVFLRKTMDGRALFVHHNGEVSPYGYLEIGIVTHLKEGVGFRYVGGNFYTLYVGDFHHVPTYDRVHTANAIFTFGVQGFDIYVKFNGVECVRFKEYRHMAPGTMAVQANNGYGFRSITVRHLVDQPLFSPLGTPPVLDMRDFGMRKACTTGDMVAGSTTVTVADGTVFHVGDNIIVETTAVRGTVGVGGTWPAKTYATVALMEADTTQVEGLYAWVTATGDVYRWLSPTWVVQIPYYSAKAIPLALHARIVAISGNVLTLDTPARVTVSHAPVWFDNAYVLNRLTRRPQYDGEMNFPIETTPNDLSALTPSNATLLLPVGTFALGYMWTVAQHAGWRIVGAGQTSTMLVSPQGVPSAMVLIDRCVGAYVADFHLKGNARDQGYGLQWSQTNRRVTESDMEQGAAYPSGLLFYLSPQGLACDLTITDVFQRAVGTSFSDDVWVYRCTNVMTDGLRLYVQWQFQWNDSVGGGCVDCTVTSPTLLAGFEAFKSKDIQFIRSKGTNATFSMNNAGNFLVQDAVITVEALSQGQAPIAFSSQNPMVNINTNIGSTYASLGGTLTNIIMIQQGYINANNDSLRGININYYNPNITVLGGSYQAPNWMAPARMPGANGVNSTGFNTLVDGFTVIGTVNADISPGANIALIHGLVRNCVADSIGVSECARAFNCVKQSTSGASVQVGDGAYICDTQ